MKISFILKIKNNQAYHVIILVVIRRRVLNTSWVERNPYMVLLKHVFVNEMMPLLV